MNSFFVTIHPSQCSEWGMQMVALLKQGGCLITFVFPIEPKKDDRPPWYVCLEHYNVLLAGLDKVPEKLGPGWPEGKQHLLVWKGI